MYSYSNPTATKEQLVTELLSFFDYPTIKLKNTLPQILTECKKSHECRKLLKTATMLYLDRILDLGTFTSSQDSMYSESYCDSSEFTLNFTPSDKVTFDGTVASFSVSLPINTKNISTCVNRIHGVSERYGLEREKINATLNDGEMKHYIIPADNCKYEFQFYSEDYGKIRQYYKMLPDKAQKYDNVNSLLRELQNDQIYA